jgi:hypothetical protein
MSLNYEAEFYRAGLLKTIKVKEHKYDLVEFTITSKLTDEETGKVIIDSGHTSFFSHREFKDFFGPIFNDMKVRLDNADSVQNG